MALKRSSSTIVIGARIVESAPTTFTEEAVDLQLNPLDNEVFVVQAINLDVRSPEAVAGSDTSSTLTLTTTSQTAVPSLASSNTLARKELTIRAQGFVDGGVGFMESFGDTPPTTLDHIGIIATNDFFLQIIGSNNGVPMTGACKVYGYRAKADAATYAALVQSEVLSS